MEYIFSGVTQVENTYTISVNPAVVYPEVVKITGFYDVTIISETQLTDEEVKAKAIELIETLPS